MSHPCQVCANQLSQLILASMPGRRWTVDAWEDKGGLPRKRNLLRQGYSTVQPTPTHAMAESAGVGGGISHRFEEKCHQRLRVISRLLVAILPQTGDEKDKQPIRKPHANKTNGCYEGCRTQLLLLL